MSDQSRKGEDKDPEPFLHLSQATNRGMRAAEDLIYALTAIILIGGALVVLVDAGYRFVTQATDDVRAAIEATLDALLIVFILVELLGAVRETLSQRRLVAEPFLLVGIIAAIKEIVVVSSFSGRRGSVANAMLEVGVLGGVVVGLCLATWLLRLKEREPPEREPSG
jgi:uncharacterized membrane protein (DUF373 family)